MQNLQHLIDDVYSGDPIKGNEALAKLIEAADEGEKFFLSQPIKDYKTVQVYRRLLHYVAARERTIIPVLADRLTSEFYSQEAHIIAKLFSGVTDQDIALNALRERIEIPIKNYTENSGSQLLAWGYAGGDSWVPWESIEKNHTLWEKSAVNAFNAACAATARVNEGDLHYLKLFVTLNKTAFEMQEVPNERTGPQLRIMSQEYWYAAYYTFSLWRRGAVSDGILHDWLNHPHYRVREFGAQILAGMGFERVVPHVIRRINIETDDQIKRSLYNALARSRTSGAADFLLAQLPGDPMAGASFVKIAELASDHPTAIRTLQNLLTNPTDEISEGLIALGKMGVRPDNMSAFLDSDHYYIRLNSMLCLGYLKDISFSDRLRSRLLESSNPTERVFLMTAICMLTGVGAADELQEELVSASGHKDYDKRIDLFYMHRQLQDAILDAFKAAGNTGEKYHAAWQTEFQSLDPIQKKARKPITSVPPAATTTAPIEIFFSYAWGEEREKIVDRLYLTLKEEKNYSVVRDRQDLEYGELILDFMQRIGLGNFVITAFSDKYLRSEYCMFELYELYRNSASDIHQLLKKIYPIRVESLTLDDPEQLGSYLAYWTQQEQKWAEYIKIHTGKVGIAHFKRYDRIRKISASASELLELIANINSSTPALLEDNSFAIIRAKIDQNAAKLKP